MTKAPATMKCAVCGRPLMRAAALLKGQPVGRVCAESKGLTTRKPMANPGNPKTQGGIDRCPDTLDLFAA